MLSKEIKMLEGLNEELKEAEILEERINDEGEAQIPRLMLRAMSGRPLLPANRSGELLSEKRENP